jgi:hypothetical protein
MIQGSRLLDLRGSGRAWSVPATSLPENITSPDGELLEGVSLPNASLCSDFLIGPSNLWVGVAVGVGKTDLHAVFEIFQPVNNSLVRLIVPEQAAKLDRYKRYPDCGWIEVCWSHCEKPELLEVQTNGVLWYEMTERANGRRVVLLGLEDLPNLLSEPDSRLALPDALVNARASFI